MPVAEDIATKASSPLLPPAAAPAPDILATAIARRLTDGLGMHLPRTNQQLETADFKTKRREQFDSITARARPSGDTLQNCALWGRLTAIFAQ
jgi:hypothetical protein